MTQKFPDNFLWGAATSSHQVEGNNRQNDWWRWEKSGATEPSGDACDHYHRFREDFALAKELGHNTHRLSIEWSRVEQEEGVWDEAEWNHYKEVVNELIKLGIVPIVTLNHFTIPLWFANKGGWINKESPKYFGRFARKAFEELGSRVEYWITINEPTILAFLAYNFGQWPPNKKSYSHTLVCLRNMLKGHVEAYKQINRYRKILPQNKIPKIGIAQAVTAFHPCSRYSLPDRLITAYRAYFHNHSFVASLMKGKILIPGIPAEKLALKDTLDFIGLNYYFRQFIHCKRNIIRKPFGEVCSLSHHLKAGKTTDMGWEIYPRGIYEVVKDFTRYKKPIIISENGIATNDDRLREAYIKQHLKYLLCAIEEGAPVAGYLHWSLLDNFEWAEGYSKRFGLIHVNFKTQARTIKESAKYLAGVIQSGKIS